MPQDVDRPGDDAEWNYAARHETPMGRLDRNWSDLLQELRVAETGVQLFTGLLLTVPFQARFGELTPHQVQLYMVIVGLSVLATGLLLTPVVLHRVLFRQHARRTLVSVGQRCALAGFAALGLAVVGVCVLIFDVVAGGSAAIAAGVVAFVIFAGLWGVGPLLLRSRVAAEEEDEA
ncbi:MAG: hypothetical protein QOH17_3298 [Pseudonocardiales bacterium]|jgi:hypothetical protein|nr:hypothetical protein [Pseudonocardiales bacterium]